MQAYFRCIAIIFLFCSFLCSNALAAPGITSISPSVGPVSPIGGSVTIKGSGFGATQNSSTVTFAGIASTPSFWSDTRVVVPVPGTLVAGFADIVVTVNGVSSNAQSFLVIPVITQDSPTHATVGTPITLTGTSFGVQQGTSTVTLNGLAAVPTSWSNTSITVPVPAGATNGTLVATINGFATNGVSFFIVPNIGALLPGAAPVGTPVAITGSGFGQTQGFGGVTFSGVSAQVQSWSDTSIVAVVPQGATAGNVVVTAANLLAGSGLNFNVILPITILAAPDRASNTAGWYSAPVTISFQCSGGLAPVSCPSPQTVSSEGANQLISGTALDSVGSSASTSINVSLDLTPPTIAIGSPADTTVTRPTLRVTGSISDATSGIANLTCNGLTPASLDSTSYIFNIPLVAGVNLIQAQTADNAGNSSTSNPISVTYSPIAPNGISISPASASMVVGDTRSVKLAGDLGQPVSGATWAISDPAIVGITTADPPQLTGLSAGTATLTATFGGLTASMTVNVVAGAIPFGTPLWSATSITGSSINGIIRANPVNDGDPDIYMIDGQSTLRGFTADGQQLWTVQLASGPASGGAAQMAGSAPLQQSHAPARTLSAAFSNLISRQSAFDPLQQQILGQRQLLAKRLTQNAPGIQPEEISAQSSAASNLAAAVVSGPSLLIQTVSDNSGNAINVVFKCLVSNCNTFTPAFIGIDHASQSQIWEHDLTDGPFLRISSIAIAPDNTIYASGVFETAPENDFGIAPTRSLLIAIDGSTGQAKFTVPIDPSHSHFTLTDRDGNITENDDADSASAIGPLAVMADGSLRAMVSSAQRSETDTLGGFGTPCGAGSSQCATALSNHLKLQLLTVQPGGGSSFQSVRAYDFDGASGCAPCSDPGSGNFYTPGDTIPDGLDGTLAEWTENQSALGGRFQLSEHIRHVDNLGGVVDYTLPGLDLVPGNLAADPGENLVLGENNIAFGVGLKIASFDVTSGTEICSTPFLSPKGAGLVAPIIDGGLLAVDLTFPVFGAIDAVESFDASCAASVSPLPAALSGISVFDAGKLLALASGNGELILGSGSLAAALAPLAWLPNGNAFVQRAPVRPQITFDKQVVKAGISLIGKDVRGTLKATIKPKSAAQQITFRSTNKARATVSEENRVDGADSTVVTLRVLGIAATPSDKPKGDAQVTALLGGNPTGDRLFVLVVVPTSQTHTVAPVTLTNTATPGTQNGAAVTEIRTSLDTVATITIKDQFGQTLDSVYDGNNVVTEQFSNTTEQGLPEPHSGPALPIVESPITEPDSALTNGIKLDAISIDAGTLIPGSFNQGQIQGWQNGTLFLVTSAGRFNNVFSFANQHVFLTGTQTIRVHGYQVSPNYIRTEEASPNNHPPIPFSATDIPVQAP
ncbi:MAG: IPT/TIG domain-containing protein [Acidobacteriia bacterium]|nr:IPT/TIG domain-containing protein [Terriglobia bacterium]